MQPGQVPEKAGSAEKSGGLEPDEPIDSVIRVAARLVKHSQRLVFQIAEVGVTKWMLAQVVERIRQLGPASGWWTVPSVI